MNKFISNCQIIENMKYTKMLNSMKDLMLLRKAELNLDLVHLKFGFINKIVNRKL